MKVFALYARKDGTVVLNAGQQPHVFKSYRKAFRFLVVAKPEIVKKQARCISGIYQIEN